MKNIFVEGIQGSGKSTLINNIVKFNPELHVCREGDYSPIELAWCALMSKKEYEAVLQKYNSIRDEIIKNTVREQENYIITYTMMHISGRFAEVDIERVKVDIESGEVDIRNKLLSFSDTISEKTINHTVEIFSKCGKENCFGRTIVEEITGLKPSGASKLIKLLVDSEVIVPVTGHGKGKYRFQ